MISATKSQKRLQTQLQVVHHSTLRLQRRKPVESHGERVFRGTDRKPVGFALQACLSGSKQALLVDTLKKPGGATMVELVKAMARDGKPWAENTVRSAFGWDLRRKGYGVRSQFDVYGVERFHLVVPEGQTIPPHALRGTGAGDARRN